MSTRRFFAAALLVGLSAAAANADEAPTRVFHIGIVAGSPRSSDERVAFEDRLRELGYVEGQNLAIDYFQDDDLNRLAAAVGEMARSRVDVLLIGGQDEVIKAVTTARSVPVVTTAVDSRPAGKGLHRQSFTSGRKPDRGGLSIRADGEAAGSANAGGPPHLPNHPPLRHRRG